MASQPPESIHLSMRRIRDSVVAILERSPECGAEAGQIFKALARIEDATSVDLLQSPPRARPGIQAGHAPEAMFQRNKPKAYRREIVGGREMLAEYRHDNATPLRSPKNVVIAVAEVLATAGEPLSFGEIQDFLTERLGQKPAEYQGRIALRFLASPDLNLVARTRAHYSATEARKLVKSTRTALESMSDS